MFNKGGIMYSILIIDDDIDILMLLKKILEKNNYKVTAIRDLYDYSYNFFSNYDLILLDIMLENTDGYSICKEIRKICSVPIVFLTAKNMEEDIIKGFKIGADDYITKPFSIEPLLARIESHIRREQRNKINKNVKKIGLVKFLFEEKKVEVESKLVSLTSNEYCICELLALNCNKVFSKEEIYNNLYNIDSDTLITSIHEYIYQIRKKFSLYNINPIKTMWGIGYQWEI